MNQVHTCPVCGFPADHFSTLIIRGEFRGEYVRCSSCELIFAADPQWLANSFTDVLNGLDIGSVDRCGIVADFVEVLLKSIKVDHPKVLDWGGGYGLLTRLLRDRGMDCSHFDPYVDPLFAKNVDPHSGEKFELVILSEVMLHLTNPVDVLADLLKISKRVMFTAVLAPHDVSANWWYFMPETGQHVTIFSQRSIMEVGKALNASALSDKKFFHLISQDRPGFATRLLFTRRFVPFGFSALLYLQRQMRRAFGRSVSLLQSDQNELIASLPWKRKPQ